MPVAFQRETVFTWRRRPDESSRPPLPVRRIERQLRLVLWHRGPRETLVRSQRHMNRLDALLDHASELIRLGQYREALSLLEGLSDQERSHWNALYLTGQCYRFLDDLDRAIFYLRQAA